MDFTNKADVQKFGRILQEKLLSIGEELLANELYEWDNDFFTTPSEFLGEMKIILEKITTVKALDDETMNSVLGCLSAINKSFSQ